MTSKYAGTGHPATLCWIAAGAVDEAVAAWTFAAHGDTASVDTLQVGLPGYTCKV